MGGRPLTTITAVLALACWLLLLPPVAQAAPGAASGASSIVNVQPARHAPAVPPGEAASVQSVLHNRGEGSLTVSSEVVPLCTAAEHDGLGVPCRSGGGPGARWFTVFPATASVDAGDRQPFRITLTVPVDAPAGVYPVGVRLESEASSADGSGVNVLSSLVVQVLLTVPGDLTEAMAVTPGSIPRFVPSRGRLPFSATISNSGTSLVQVSRAEVGLQAFGPTAAQELDMPRPVLLPGGERTVSVTWRELPLVGTYVPEVTVESASGLVVQESWPRVWVLPPWWVWVLLAAALVPPVLVRARRRRQLRRIQDLHDR